VAPFFLDHPVCMYVVGVVSAQEMAALFPDRVIAIRGGIDNISQAESAISAKLAECIEHEMQQGLGMVSYSVFSYYIDACLYCMMII